MQERKKDTIFVLIFKKSREAFSGVAIILQRLGENGSSDGSSKLARNSATNVA